MRFNRQKKFYLKLTKEDIDKLFREFPEALGKSYRTYFTNVIRYENLAVKLLRFMEDLNTKHGTRFFDQVSPTEADLDQINLCDNQLTRNMADLQNATLASLRSKPNPDNIKAILKKFNIYF